MAIFALFTSVQEFANNTAPANPISKINFSNPSSDFPDKFECKDVLGVSSNPDGVELTRGALNYVFQLSNLFRPPSIAVVPFFQVESETQLGIEQARQLHVAMWELNTPESHGTSASFLFARNRRIEPARYDAIMTGIISEANIWLLEEGARLEIPPRTPLPGYMEVFSPQI